MSVKNNHTVVLKSFVMFEKCSQKKFICNAEKLLNNVGIAVYIWSSTDRNANNVALYYSSVSTLESLNKLIEIYGLDNLADFYAVLISNEKLKRLPYCEYNVQKIGYSSILKADGHHDKYRANILTDSFGRNHSCRIYCMTKRILKSSGYEIPLPFEESV